MILSIILSSLLTAVLIALSIPILKKLNFGQTILKYVREHKKKNGTPTFGGLFFCISTVIVYYSLFGFKSRLANTVIIIGTAYMLIGFLDDFIKVKTHDNLGLKAYQKIIFQSAISLIASIFAYKNNLVLIYIPFVKESVYIGAGIIPLIFFVFLATTNSVNLTDGLDGLASATSIPFIFSVSALIVLEVGMSSNAEITSLADLSVIIGGSLLGYLLFNVNKAQIFMGDTGSMALGGYFASICVFSGNVLFIPIIGIMFVISSISVIVQVILYKKTGKRVLLMAPYHHHLQMKGLSESKIAYIYFYITAITGLLSVYYYL